MPTEWHWLSSTVNFNAQLWLLLCGVKASRALADWGLTVGVGDGSWLDNETLTRNWLPWWHHSIEQNAAFPFPDVWNSNGISNKWIDPSSFDPFEREKEKNSSLKRAKTRRVNSFCFDMLLFIFVQSDLSQN